MKYWAGRYAMTAEDAASLANKKNEFKLATKTRKAVHLTMITSFGCGASGARFGMSAEISKIIATR